MATLLLRLCGPMQSWGTRSRFTERDTEMEPSKSGVVGLLCAALGRPRSSDVSDLAALRMGVRVDHEGVMARDYHTAGAPGVGPARLKEPGIAKASGGLYRAPDGRIVGQLSNRYYLADADFLVGLESSDDDLLYELDAGLRAPVWQLYLGRKSFVPAVPVDMPGGGIRDLPLREALEGEPWPLPFAPLRLTAGEHSRRLRLVLESALGSADSETRMDQPIGAAFVSRDRRFGPRAITQYFFEKERTDVPVETHA